MKAKNNLTKKQIKDTLLEKQDILYNYKVKSIALFGSYIRNEQGKNSDVDLLLEFEKSTFDNYIGLLSDLKKIFHRRIDLVSIKALKERIKPYILKDAEWIKKG